MDELRELKVKNLMTINQLATITGKPYANLQNRFTRGSQSATKSTPAPLTLYQAFPHDINEPKAGGGGVYIVCDDKLKLVVAKITGEKYKEVIKEISKHFEFV